MPIAASTWGGTSAWRPAHLPLDGAGPLFDGALATPRRGADLTPAQRVGDLLLASGEGGRLAEGAVERVQRLLLPRAGHGVPLAAQRVGHVAQRVGGLLPATPCTAGVALPSRARRLLHRGAGGASRSLRLRQRGRTVRAAREILPRPFEPLRQGVGALAQHALRRRRR